EGLYSSIVMRAISPAAAADLAQRLDESRQVSVDAQTETAYYDQQGQSIKNLQGAVWVIAWFMGIGAIFGVMNTMFAAISQRIKDIGVLQILGYARWQILVSFLLESLVLALIGGMIGCAVGYVCDGWTATSIVGSGQGGGKSVILKLAVDAQVLGAGLSLTLVMGLLGGLIPALSAMRLKPLDAVR
ncbi:MAG TPA: ABC transporter permease, partial [Pirellulaceae bacterium]|nr:ABC transporter permease [Pirellulaceae bacterium]